MTRARFLAGAVGFLISLIFAGTFSSLFFWGFTTTIPVISRGFGILRGCYSIEISIGIVKFNKFGWR
jgi:hypothetical protein